MKVSVDGYLKVIEKTDHYECECCGKKMSPRRITFINHINIDVLLECRDCGTALPLLLNESYITP